MLLRFYISCFALLLVFSGCITAPDSIKQLSTLDLQMWNSVEQDYTDAAETSHAELMHWVTLSFRYAAQEKEKELLREDGSVDLAAYKAAMDEIATQFAAVTLEYERDKLNAVTTFNNEVRKAKIAQMLIAEYENSKGVSPESIDALLTEFSEFGKAYASTHGETDAGTDTTLKAKLDLFLKGKLTQGIERIRANAGGFNTAGPVTSVTVTQP